MIKLLHGDCLDHLRTLPDDLVDAVVTDPPYGLGKSPPIGALLAAWMSGEDYSMGPGFMGAEWDEVPGPSVWREVFRVLKPGGHAVIFAGARTVDLMGIAVRLGGFEVRDVIHWCYANGQVHSMDIAKAIDKMRHDRDQVLQVTAWIRKARDAAGLRNRDIDQAFGLNGMAGHWTSQASQPAVPTLDQWEKLVELLGAEVPPEIERLAVELNSNKGEPGPDWERREFLGRGQSGRTSLMGGLKGTEGEPGHDITAPASEEAKAWEGWGTATKSSVEPALLVRKPISETSVARNVIRWGTGGLNIDATRFAPGDPMWPLVDSDELPETHSQSAQAANRGITRGGGWQGMESHQTRGQAIGRWPANLVFHVKASRKERELGCSGLPARTGAEAVKRKEGSAGIQNARAGAGRTAGEVRNFHPTVKPLGLMRWLVRLVTPPGGVVLDPFTGSGTTGMAAAGQGFGFIGCELEADHVQIARARIEFAATGQAVDCDLEDVREPAAQVDMFG